MDVGYAPAFEAHGVGGLRVLRQVIDQHFIQPGRQRIDGLDRAQQLTVLAPRHFAGNEDAQVTDGGMA
ncbi:hypothetical protein D9M71_759730 [compost metagenome]